MRIFVHRCGWGAMHVRWRRRAGLLMWAWMQASSLWWTFRRRPKCSGSISPPELSYSTYLYRAISFGCLRVMRFIRLLLAMGSWCPWERLHYPQSGQIRYPAEDGFLWEEDGL